MPRLIPASALRVGDTIILVNTRFNQRVVDINDYGCGTIKIRTLFADSHGPSEPATSMYAPNHLINVDR
jgi:hypothetical protein